MQWPKIKYRNDKYNHETHQTPQMHLSFQQPQRQPQQQHQGSNFTTLTASLNTRVRILRHRLVCSSFWLLGMDNLVRGQ